MKSATVSGNSMQNLHTRYRKPLLAFFLRRCASPEDAEDMTQEVFLKLLALGEGRAVDNLDAFLFTVASNVARDRQRRERVRCRDAHVSVEEVNEEGVLIELMDVGTPERILAGHQSLSAASRALSRLPPRTRLIFLLYRVEQLRQREIAQLMNVSQSTVEKHLMRATARLVTLRESALA